MNMYNDRIKAGSYLSAVEVYSPPPEDPLGLLILIIMNFVGDLTTKSIFKYD
jgi:hypothetical protein